jgi:HD-like signal output (HDOD) protein
LPNRPTTSIASDPGTGIDYWVERIRDRDMPIFGATARMIDRVIESESASAAVLSKVILRDAGMAARVLALANSAYFSLGHQGVATVSRAILMLGFDAVRAAALSVALIDALATGGVRARVHAEMARAFHAAVQARQISAWRGDGGVEEVFIGALLAQIGTIAFWCYSGDLGVRLDQALRADADAGEEVEERVLGFRLRHLTAVLAREWQLTPMVSLVAQGAVSRRSREFAVMLGHRLALATARGWHHATMVQVVGEISEYCGRTPEDLYARLEENARAAAEVARSYGALAAADLIAQCAPAADEHTFAQLASESIEASGR